jgi:hypothetical protein
MKTEYTFAEAADMIGATENSLNQLLLGLQISEYSGYDHLPCNEFFIMEQYFELKELSDEDGNYLRLYISLKGIRAIAQLLALQANEDEK